MKPLIVRRTIDASPEFLFDAWTSPDALRQWWGPEHVECPSAEVDLRIGGRYRIENRLPDGSTIWISGEFESIERPREIVYTWRVNEQPDPERVTVKFEPREDATEVIVIHERIADEEVRRTHEGGWIGCLDGLAAFAARA
jgi:uncharacterized protein YndB with AHSA1/START domain